MIERRDTEVAKLRPRAHSIHIDNRMRISVTGVMDVEASTSKRFSFSRKPAP